MFEKSVFEEDLKREILARGPLPLGDVMGRAVAQYYAHHQPFGRSGDFMTAPEISQIFGELIGIWCADVWQKLGSPAAFHLIECGPGRGTLMADALRATRSVPGFHAALCLHLLETSPTLRTQQQEKLTGFEPQFHDALATIPPTAPCIVIGNEFLDALPIEQIKRIQSVWHQRFVDVHNDTLTFVWQKAPASFLPNDLPDTESIVEISPAQDTFWRDLCALITKQSGAVLMIDYGYADNETGETLQALYQKAPCFPLENLGAADLTAHVNFTRLKRQAPIPVHGPVTQAQFLENMGLSLRRAALLNLARGAQAHDILLATQRLVAPDQMGNLFKVIALSSGLHALPAGF